MEKTLKRVEPPTPEQLAKKAEDDRRYEERFYAQYPYRKNCRKVSDEETNQIMREHESLGIGMTQERVFPLEGGGYLVARYNLDRFDAYLPTKEQ